jgi:STE24 endopeptidase
MRYRLLLLTGLIVCLLTGAAAAQSTPGQLPGTAMPKIDKVPAGAQASPNFNAEAATDAYLALIPPETTAKSDAYFEGGYWMTLWDFVYGVVVALLLLNLRWSAGMRDLAERITRFKPLQTLIYWVEYLILTTILLFPLTVYEGYFREHKYGLATQTFGPWLVDQLKGLAVGLVLGGIAVMILFGIVRRLTRSWWIWGAIVSEAFVIILILITPVFLIPIFNTPKRLEDPKITQPILAMARANGIPVHDVYEIDASKQSTRMSANVSGFGHTMRITLNDNLLRRGSTEEIQAVMGHEMGHYVLNHIYNTIIFLLIVIVCFFAFLRWGLEWSRERWGEKWQIRGIGDPAVIPLVVLLGSIFFFVLTPVLNTFTRTQEHEADMYGLNASRQPDGFAQAAIHLGEYRKMSPGTLEEWVFYDHPSGRHRIHDAMTWKSENLKLVSGDGAGYGPAVATNPSPH